MALKPCPSRRVGLGAAAAGASPGVEMKPRHAPQTSFSSAQRRPRNVLASQIIQGLEGLLDGYPAHGFQAQHAEFLKANYLKGLTVAVSEGEKQVLGEVVDVDVDGALVVRTGLGNRRFLSGEVNVRL